LCTGQFPVDPNQFWTNGHYSHGFFAGTQVPIESFVCLNCGHLGQYVKLEHLNDVRKQADLPPRDIYEEPPTETAITESAPSTEPGPFPNLTLEERPSST
jgi:hypothetical protein